MAIEALRLKKIGIFGGTFDPIHHGHLILAREALETLDLETIIFIPAAASPHKLGQELTAPDVRLEMLRAAIENEPGFGFDRMELDRSAPSYAVDTVEALRQRQPNAKFFYLIGEDHIARLATWHRFVELSKMAEFVVLVRSGLTIEHPYLTIHRHLDISATNIRNRVATGRSIRYLVPSPVEKIIRDRQLYMEPQK
jgi:nicotinate-nucleotide adenylyltransferase